MLSTVKSIDKYLHIIREQDRKKLIEEHFRANGHAHIALPELPKPINHTYKYIKMVLNYCVAFNNSFLIGNYLYFIY